MDEIFIDSEGLPIKNSVGELFEITLSQILDLIEDLKEDYDPDMVLTSDGKLLHKIELTDEQDRKLLKIRENKNSKKWYVQ